MNFMHNISQVKLYINKYIFLITVIMLNMETEPSEMYTFLNQMRAGHRPAYTWFLEIVSSVNIGICVCVCVHP